MFKYLKEITHNLRFETKRLFTHSAFTSKTFGVSDLLPFGRFVDESIILNVDGSFTTLRKIKPADLDAETNEVRAHIRLIVHNAFSQLGTGWSMHDSMIKRESSGYIPESECYFNDATTYIVDQERRMQYDHEDTHFEDEYFIAFTYLPSSDRFSKFGAWFATGADKKTGFDYTIHLNEFKDKVWSVLNVLGSSQFKIFKMSDDEIFSHLAYCVNGIRANLRCPQRHWTDLRHMISVEDLTTGTSPKIGDNYIRVISMGEGFPLETYPMLLRGLNNLRFELWWSTRYIFLSDSDATKIVDDLAEFHNQGRENAAKVLSKNYGDGTSGKVNRSAARYEEEANELLDEIERNGVKMGKYTSTVVLFDTNPERLKDKAKIVQGVIQQCRMLGKYEKVHCVPAYLGSIPGMVRPNVRKWNMKSNNLSDLMPTSSIWSGYNYNPCQLYKDNNPVLFYAATSGNTPFRGCLHVENDGHTLIVGSKSAMVMNFLAAQQCRYKNAKVIIFDNNHAALPLTYSIPNSVHYDLGYDNGIAFQPLANLDLHEDFTFAVEWLSNLCLVNDFKIKPQHISIISETLAMIRDNALYKQRTMSYFSYHTRPKGESMEEFAEQFKPYISTSGGLQGKIFDATEDNLNLEDFTVFEMSHLTKMGDTTLIPAILYLLHTIERNLDGSPVSIYIHDGFTVFKHPVFRNMLDDWLRKIADRNVQIIIGVDQPSDVMKSDIADILMQTCKTKIFTANLNAKGTQKSGYEQMGLNDTQINLISNALVNQQYYFTNPLGSRLIEFNFGDVAKTFLSPPALEDIKVVRQLKLEHGDMFGYEWIKHKQLYPEIAEFWLKKHKEFYND